MVARRFLGLVAFLCAATVVSAQPPAAGGLKIVVIDGEDGVNIVRKGTAVAPVVEVRDRNNLPVAGALVTFLGLPEGATTATITSTSQLFRPVTGGTVRAVAVPVHRGRTTVTAQTSLFDSNDRLVAQTTQIQAVRGAA